MGAHFLYRLTDSTVIQRKIWIDEEARSLFRGGRMKESPPRIEALFDNLRVWKRGGERAPHKPLLLLLTLSRLQCGEERLVPYADIDQPLRRLIETFGPPRRSVHTEYPFWRLQNDGVWEVHAERPLRTRKSNSDPTKKELLSARATGGFRKEIHDAFRGDHARLSAVAWQLLRAHFPESVHSALLAELRLRI
jgi:putative restriction endonuclease